MEVRSTVSIHDIQFTNVCSQWPHVQWLHRLNLVVLPHVYWIYEHHRGHGRYLQNNVICAAGDQLGCLSCSNVL